MDQVKGKIAGLRMDYIVMRKALWVQKPDIAERILAGVIDTLELIAEGCEVKNPAAPGKGVGNGR